MLLSSAQLNVPLTLYVKCSLDLLTTTLSLLQVACFVYYVVILNRKGCVVDATNGVSLWSPMIYNPRRRYEAWRFLTYTVIHVG